VRQPRRLFSVLVAGACSALLWGAGLCGTPASASSAASPPVTANVLPAHVFAPYASPSNNLTTTAANAGVHYLTLDFLQTPQAGSCTVDWNGNPSTPVGSYAASIAALQAEGGQVVPSFGGSAADSDGTELADSCHSVADIAAAYENVITTYNVTRLDLDTEEDSLNNYAGINRRNQAIAMVERWARQTGRTVQFVYTIPTNTTGIDQGGAYVLQNAVENHAKIAVVDIMTFDYYDNLPHEMADNTDSAATAIYNVLRGLYPGKSPAQVWSMIGLCEDIGSGRHPGRDDYGNAETFTIADAQVVEQWAAARGLAELTFWNLSGDNSATAPYQYSHAFEPFTSTASASPASVPGYRLPPSASAGLTSLVDPPTGNLRTVSCPDTRFCMAVGEYGNTAIRWDGRSWSAPVQIDPGGARVEVTSVSCASARFCAAVDTLGRVLEWNGFTWSPPEPIAGGSGLTSVSCPAGQQAFCVAVDGSGDALTYRDGSWSRPALVDDSGASLQSVSCASAAFCMAGDWDGNVVEFTGSSWSAPVSLETTTESAGGGIGSISCPTAAFCVAVDWEGSEMTWNGTSWSAPDAFDPNGAGGLISVSCLSASLCTAVDGSGDALTWNGTTWTSTEIDVTGDGAEAVSCASAAFCMAVDWNGNAQEWNGASWTQPAISCPDTTPSSAGTCTFTGPFTDARAGVVASTSCPTRTFCAAVDDNGNALTWNGRQWSAPVLLDPIAGVFTSVSCASPRFCAAVDGNGYAFEWNGQSWSGTTQFSITSPTDPNPGGLQSVSCPASADGQFCVAVDAVGDAVIWNGTSWSAPEPIDPGADLTAVSCTSATSCVAEASGRGTVSWDGTSWQ
jgi:phage-related protein